MNKIHGLILIIIGVSVASLSQANTDINSVINRLEPLRQISALDGKAAAELRPFLNTINQQPYSTKIHFLVLLQDAEIRDGNLKYGLELNQQLEILHKTQAIDPELWVYSKLIKGRALRAQGNYQEAIVQLQKADESARNHGFYYISFKALQALGDVKVTQDHYAQAMSYYRRARQLQVDQLLYQGSPTDRMFRESEVVYRKALVYGRMGRHQDAINHLLEVIELDRTLGNEPNVRFSLYQLALQHLQMGSYSESKRYALELLAFIEKTNITEKSLTFGTYGLLLANHLHLEEYQQAETALKTALRLMPGIEDNVQIIRFNIAKAQWHLHQKQYHEALATLAGTEYNSHSLSGLNYKKYSLMTQAQQALGLHQDALASHRKMHKVFLERNNTLQLISAEVERANFDFDLQLLKNSVLKRETEIAKINLENKTKEATKINYQLLLAIILIASLSMVVLVQYRHRKDLKKLSEVDSLTEIYNRRCIIEYGQKLLQDGNNDTTVLLIDLDHFKQINDSFGHAFGDLVLTSVAKAAKQVLGKDGVVGRIGGEEFLMVLPNTNIIQAQSLARQFSTKLSKLRLSNQVTITASIGISIATAKDNDFSRLMDAADVAMYKAKKNGRNRVESAEILTVVP